MKRYNTNMVEKFSEDTSTPRNDPQVWLQVMDQI
jgi:hypothetical protein